VNELNSTLLLSLDIAAIDAINLLLKTDLVPRFNGSESKSTERIAEGKCT
jgi:hypothetical protein